ncbi:MAG: co-chaperone GroES [Deltaproteobacteria bacterium]|jgi:chaperonin GroES|nr:co-chaperone GroES [Deltaproteobacteria bacterium]
MKVKPLYDRVLIRRVQEEEKTKGGIIIPDSAKEKPAEGEVIAVGAGRVTDKGVLQALQVKKGDRVLFGKYSGNEIKIDGQEHLIVKEDEILGVLEK